MTSLQQKIISLKQDKGALILAHYYQTMDIQEVADHVGDSFELAKRAKAAKEQIIVLCGVRFMAESAKILNPDKTVLLPSPDAGCPMADMITPEDVIKLKKQYPDAAVVCYVNSSAAVKAESDICCTSSSAVKIVRSLPEKRVIFIPDRNLGTYAASQVPEKEFILFSGFCPVHQQVRSDDVRKAKAAHPGARVLAHPECPPEVLGQADYIGSTSGILDYVQNSGGDDFIIGTELGICERLKRTAPGKKALPLAESLVCRDMKKTKIEDLLRCLENNVYEISLPEDLRRAAFRSLDRMVSVR